MTKSLYPDILFIYSLKKRTKAGDLNKIIYVCSKQIKSIMLDKLKRLNIGRNEEHRPQTQNHSITGKVGINRNLTSQSLVCSEKTAKFKIHFVCLASRVVFPR